MGCNESNRNFFNYTLCHKKVKLVLSQGSNFVIMNVIRPALLQQILIILSVLANLFLFGFVILSLRDISLRDWLMDVRLGDITG